MESNTILLTNIPTEYFNNAELIKNMETEFNQYGHVKEIAWLKSFRRVLVVFSSFEEAKQAKEQLITKLSSTDIKVFYGNPTEDDETVQYLTLPEREKLFLISPPPSPPGDWEQIREHSPVPVEKAHAPDHQLLSLLLSELTKDFQLDQQNESENNNEMKQIQSFVKTSQEEEDLYLKEHQNDDLPAIIVHDFDRKENFIVNLIPELPPTSSLPKTRMPDFAQKA